MAIARVAVLFAGLALASASSAEIVLKNAWMRPAVAGAAARAYVDITSDTSLTLVGAKTPVAKRVELVRVATIGDPTTEKVVKSIAVPANTTTRLAYHGDHVRFVDMNRNVGNGDPVPLTLLFKDAKGKRSEATTDVLVRGLLRPQQMPEAARDAPPPPPGKAASPAKQP